MKTYGTCTYNKIKRCWTLIVEPHVAIRVKRWFAKIDTYQYGTLSISATPENCRDLEVFLQRYPLVVQPWELLKERADEHKERQSIVEGLLAGNFDRAITPMKLPAREYQELAAHMWLTTHNLLLADDVGLGKAQPLSSKILTPSGWVRMGDIRVGDKLVDPDGGMCFVEGVYPQGVRDVYRVTTKDGGSTLCCDEHLWTVQNPNDRVRGGWRTLTTLQLLERTKWVRGNGNQCSGWFLPIASPVEFYVKGTLPLAPYLTGCLLGDGTIGNSSVRFTTADEWLRQEISTLLPVGHTLNKAGASKYDYRISKAKHHRKNVVLTAFRQLGLAGHRSWEKFIPQEYLLASIQDRMDILAGLLDTDGGWVGSAIEYSSTSKQLTEGVRDLVGSLGGYASFAERATQYSYKGGKRQGRKSYRLYIRLPFNPFRLPRKSEQWSLTFFARAIDSIVPTGREGVQCIQVSSHRNLYITDDYIVTHNTASSICGLVNPATLPALVVSLSHMPWQWEGEFKKFSDLTCHILRKTTPYDILQYTDGKLPDIIITNYHKLSGWSETIAPILKSVVFDECQELRHRDSQKYKAAKHISDSVEYRLGLSATPIYNYGGEIWSVMNIVTPDALGSWEEFNREWCTYISGDKPKIKDPAAFGLYAREMGLMLRRTRKDVKRELPEVTIIPQKVEIDPAHLNFMKGPAIELAKIILKQGQDFKGQKMQASGEFDLKMRQATGIAKAPYVGDFVRSLVETSDEPVIVGVWHREVYSILMEKLKDLNPVMYSGSETPVQKEASKQKFLKGESKVMLLSLRSGAGMDGLQDLCHVIVLAELDWSPGVHKQFIGRVHRDGQDDPVTAYYVLCDYGSDPTMCDVLGVKKQQADGVIDPTSADLSDLQVDAAYIKKMAEHYLTQNGIEVPKQSDFDAPK